MRGSCWRWLGGDLVCGGSGGTRVRCVLEVRSARDAGWLGGWSSTLADSFHSRPWCVHLGLRRRRQQQARPPELRRGPCACPRGLRWGACRLSSALRRVGSDEGCAAQACSQLVAAASQLARHGSSSQAVMQACCSPLQRSKHTSPLTATTPCETCASHAGTVSVNMTSTMRPLDTCAFASG